jgi:hypothetical protein
MREWGEGSEGGRAVEDAWQVPRGMPGVDYKVKNGAIVLANFLSLDF